MSSTKEPVASPSLTPAEPKTKDVQNEEDVKRSESGNKSNRDETTAEDGEIEQSESNEKPAPPLPSEAPPPVAEDDGWDPVWEPTAQAFYFYNRFTHATQWTNPRVPDPLPEAVPTAPGVSPSKVTEPLGAPPPPPSEIPVAGGYNPAIHGDYDPNAWYAQAAPKAVEFNPSSQPESTDPAAQYAASAAFNRFTGRYQAADITPDNYNDENKSKRQMNAFFDVDAAANSHDGKSLKAERSGKKLSKTELKQFKEKRKAKKEEKRRAWLRD